MEQHWDAIARIGAELGAKPEAIKKWRQRGRVSGKWLVPIALHAKAQGIDIPLQAFRPANIEAA